MDRQPRLEGGRLLLRPLRQDDWDALYASASDARIWEDHPARNRWEKLAFRDFFDDAIDQGGALAVLDKARGVIIGSSRFQGFDAADGGSVEIGWTFLARDYWGGETNRELKSLMVGHALKWVEKVNFHVGAHNQRSRRAMEKVGGRLTGKADVITLPDGDHPYVYYEIDRASFAAGPLSRAGFPSA